MSLGSIEDQEHKRLIYGEDNMPTQAEDLLHYLAGEFQSGEPLRISTRRSDAVGRQIADREVSRLEVLSAIKQLRYRQRRVMELLYVENVPKSEVAQQLGISARTVDSDRADALETMTETIYEWAN